MNFRFLLFASLLLGVLVAVGSVSANVEEYGPSYCPNNCNATFQEPHLYIIAIGRDIVSWRFDYVKDFVFTTLTSIFAGGRQTAVVMCVHSSLSCSYVLESPEMAFRWIRGLNQQSGTFDLNEAVRGAFEAIRDYIWDLNVAQSPILSYKKKMLIYSFGSVDTSYNSRSYISQAKSDGYEVFVHGNSGNPLWASYPTESHYFHTDSQPGWSSIYEEPFRQFLGAVRGDTSFFCSIHGFGVPHVLTMDGSAYDFPGHGEYVLLTTTDSRSPMTVVVRQTARETPGNATARGATELRAVSIKVRNSVEANFFYDPVEDIFTLFEGGMVRDLSDSNYDINYVDNERWYWGNEIEFVAYKRAPYGGYRINVLVYEGIEMQIEFSRYGSGIVIIPFGQLYGGTGGLCGTYDSFPPNDFTMPDRTVIDPAQFLGRRSDSRDAFFEAWKVKPEDSPFELLEKENYEPPANWRPLTSAPGFSRARQYCDGLPTVLRNNCLFDVGASRNLYGSWLSHELLRVICSRTCSYSNALVPSHLDPENSCKRYCESTNPEPLHTRYNGTILPEIVMRGSNSRKAFFKSAINLGGVYTFRVRANDLCDDQEREIKVSISCDAAPRVNPLDYVAEDGRALRSPNITARITSWGFPWIHLFASVEGGGNPESHRYSWRVVNMTLPPDTREEDYPFATRVAEANARLSYGLSLRPIFHPDHVAIYTLELAVSDGCQVTRKELVVEVQCSGCPPAPRIDAGQTEVFWSKPSSAVGSWPSKSVLAVTPDVDHVPQTFPVEWRITGYRGGEIRKESSTEFVALVTLAPETVVFQNTTTEQFSTPEVSGTSTEGPPFPLSEAPFAIYELYKVTTTTTWVESTNVTTLTVTQEEEIEERCKLTITNPTSMGPTISFTEPETLTSTTLARCPGYYAMTVITHDDCGSGINVTTGHNASETAWLHLDCRHHPRAVATCPHRVFFDYDQVRFPEVTLDGSGSYDPRPSAPSTLDHLHLQWSLVSQPPSSEVTLSSTSTSTNFQPDFGGTYTFQLAVSNQCNDDFTTTTVEAVCTEDRPNPTAVAASSTADFDGTNPSEFELFTTSVHAFPDILGHHWEVTAVPSVAPEVVATGHNIFQPSFADDEAANTTFSTYLRGQHRVTVTVTDFCTQPISREVVLTHNCPEITTEAESVPATVNYDYDLQAFPSVSLDASASSSANHNSWYQMSSPSSTTPTHLSSANTHSFTPSEPGAYSFRFVHSDRCRYNFLNRGFSAVCPQTPTATITASATTILVGEQVTLDGEDSGDDIISYDWYLVSSPTQSGIRVLLDSAASFNYTPAEGNGQYEVELEVSDGCRIATATRVLTVNCPAFQFSPVASSPSGTSVYGRGKFSRVDVDGSTSTLQSPLEPSDFGYRWEIVAAPTGSVYAPYSNETFEEWEEVYLDEVEYYNNLTHVTSRLSTVREYERVETRVFLSNPTNPMQHFGACFYPDLPGQYTLTLTLTTDSFDNPCETRTSSEITVNAACNDPPVVSASNQQVELVPNVQTRIVLDASGTTDPNNDQLTFLWVPVLDEDDEDAPINQLEPLSNPNSAIASFIAVRGGSYPFRLTVSDGCSTVTTTVTVTAVCPYVDEIAGDRRKQREAEKDMITSRFSGMELSREAFTLQDSLLAATCVHEYSWTLVDYDGSSIGRASSQFRGSAAEKAAIAVPIVVIIIIIAIIVGIVLYKKFSGPGRSSDTKMKDLQTGSPQEQAW